MVDYEKGTPAWDISHILTRHATGRNPCTRVLELRRTTPSHGIFASSERLRRALDTPCNCGAGNTDTERTSLLTPKPTE